MNPFAGRGTGILVRAVDGSGVRWATGGREMDVTVYGFVDRGLS